MTAFVVLSAFVCACGTSGPGPTSESDVTPEAGVDAATGGDDAGGAAPEASTDATASGEDSGGGAALSAQTLCDGRAGLRFAIVQYNGGEILAGTQVLDQNGSYYLLLDGRCVLTIYASGDGGLGVVRTVQLSAAETAQLIADFRLARWTEAVGQFCVTGVADYPTWVAALDGLKLVFQGCRPGEPDSSARAEWIVGAFERVRERRFEAAQPWNGDVRFVLVRESPSSRPDDIPYQDAPSWPLALDAAEIALSLQEADQLAPERDARLAKGADAVALRALRKLTADGAIGMSGYPFSGVVDAEGRRYQLFQRDAIELEDEQGALPLPWTH